MDGSEEYTNISLICDEDDSFFFDDAREQYKKQSKCESTRDVSNKPCTDNYCSDSSSDIDILRECRDSGEAARLLKKKIKDCRRILKLKRQELCNRITLYYLISPAPIIPNICSIATGHTSPKTEFEVPNQMNKQVDSESPSSPDPIRTDVFIHKKVAQGIPEGTFDENQISYGFSEESLIQMVIQRSLEDVIKSQASSSSASGASSNAQTESENQSYPEGSSKDHKKPFAAVSPLLGWNICSPDTETQNQHREAGDNIEDINPVLEDFMEGERYVGDKGKRPLSGKYCYKKRSKTSTVSDEQLSGSSLPEKDHSSK